MTARVPLTAGVFGHAALSFLSGGQFTVSAIELWVAAERDGLDEFAQAGAREVIDSCKQRLYELRLEPKNILDEIPASMLVEALHRRFRMSWGDPRLTELTPYVDEAHPQSISLAPEPRKVR